jgi:hypothetical protein
MTRTIPILLLSAALTGCAAELPTAPRSEQAQAKLQQTLAGRVAGPATACLQRQQTNDMITVDDYTVLFRRGSTYYRNDLPGGCNGLGSGFYTLVTRSPSGSLCRGDIATVADARTGVTVGSCTLGDFVPYSRP